MHHSADSKSTGTVLDAFKERLQKINGEHKGAAKIKHSVVVELIILNNEVESFILFKRNLAEFHSINRNIHALLHPLLTLQSHKGPCDITIAEKYVKRIEDSRRQIECLVKEHPSDKSMEDFLKKLDSSIRHLAKEI